MTNNLLKGYSYSDLRFRITGIYTFLILFNIIVWAVAYTLFHSQPKLIALCFLAYGFGLRHAVDADHIAAIDNVTRKFMQEKKSPVTIGFFFSLGHSSVVLILSVLVAIGTIFMKEHLPEFQRIGGLIGTSVSSVFLLIIALINLIIFIDIVRIFNAYRKNKTYNKEKADDLLNSKGLLVKLFKPIFKFISKSWHMYIVGFLFGLGFDTATEIALLGISAAQASQGMLIWIIMIFPLIFMAGMCLIDTTDGVLMLGLYGWAFVKPARKLFYNMTITLISFLIAFFIGGLEGLALIGNKLQLKTEFWLYISNLNENIGSLGYYLIGIFIVSWLVSLIIYKIADINTLPEM
jgi:nickel/cobalt transporter (NiCoT) family protein